MMKYRRMCNNLLVRIPLCIHSRFYGIKIINELRNISAVVKNMQQIAMANLVSNMLALSFPPFLCIARQKPFTFRRVDDWPQGLVLEHLTVVFSY